MNTSGFEKTVFVEMLYTAKRTEFRFSNGAMFCVCGAVSRHSCDVWGSGNTLEVIERECKS
jgi:hypothetical protein